MSKGLSWRRDGVNWPGREHSRFLTAGGIGWHVQISGAGPVALLLHGTGSSTHSWRRLAPLLAKRLTLVAPDLPGHAFTQTLKSTDLSLQGMATAVSALLAALNVRPELVIGHSAGAAIGVHLARKGHVAPRGIVSINGALRPLSGFASRVFPPVARLLALLPIVPNMFAWRARDAAVIDDLLRQTGSTIPDEDRARYQLLATTPGHIASALSMMASWDLEALEKSLSRLSVPVLLVAGAKDGMVPASDAAPVARKLPAGEVVRLKGLGHLAHEEQPERIASVILDWYDRLTAERPDALRAMGAPAA
ncbi:alpha/beta fold hydrolase BchO [Phreatobacter sp.]|uniref:alpha/beta fold hydrolase BchO n=1 Tax=Phreatobacter sp. TaxID=1966341 RepID=UPI003F6F131D